MNRYKILLTSSPQYQFDAIIADMEKKMKKQRPQLCPVCGDAVYGTGEVLGCGYPICECGDIGRIPYYD